MIGMATPPLKAIRRDRVPEANADRIVDEGRSAGDAAMNGEVGGDGSAVEEKLAAAHRGSFATEGNAPSSNERPSARSRRESEDAALFLSLRRTPADVETIPNRTIFGPFDASRARARETIAPIPRSRATGMRVRASG